MLVPVSKEPENASSERRGRRWGPMRMHGPGAERRAPGLLLEQSGCCHSWRSCCGAGVRSITVPFCGAVTEVVIATSEVRCLCQDVLLLGHGGGSSRLSSDLSSWRGDHGLWLLEVLTRQ